MLTEKGQTHRSICAIGPCKKKPEVVELFFGKSRAGVIGIQLRIGHEEVVHCREGARGKGCSPFIDALVGLNPEDQ